jgi:hypothetical protein
MNRPVCSRNEDVVRALCDSHWDERQNRFSSALFRGPNTSVSRLAILKLETIFEIFHRDLDKPPKSKVILAGEINVGKLQDIGKAHVSPNSITVEVAPLLCNPAHAEIPEKLPRSLALKIIEQLIKHKDVKVQNFYNRVPLFMRLLVSFIHIKFKMLFNYRT